MLAKLFGSNSRVKILKLFLTKTEESFYIRQISRDLKLQLNSVRRELENLEKFGLLISKFDDSIIREEKDEVEEQYIKSTSKVKKKKEIVKKEPTGIEKKFYKVNKDFVLYEEIRSLIIKAQLLYERDFVDKVQKLGSVKLLILTGFFVNNNVSIVDMFLVGRINKQKFAKLIYSLEKEMGREINFTVMDMREFKDRRDITDVFLYDILEGKNAVIIDTLTT